MNNSPYMLVKKLSIVGLTKTYSAHFEEGVNIIWGDMDSGKSSILNLIDYCLGGKNTHLTYDEIKIKARTAILEIDLNGNECTFERVISDDLSPIKVFNGYCVNRKHNYPMLMSAQSDKEMPDGWVSDFILDKLGISRVKIRESKYRVDANSYRISFRDLMKLMYLRQTKVGADSLYDYTNPSVFNKNVEIQKFVYNIHDDRLADYQQELLAEQKEVDTLENKINVINSFLRSVNVLETTGEMFVLNNKKENKLEESIGINNAILAIKSNFELSSEVSVEIKNSILDVKNELTLSKDELAHKERELESFFRLKKTYEVDINSLNISKISRENLHPHEVASQKIECPLCKSSLDLLDESLGSESIAIELRSLKNRLSGVNSIINKLLSEINDISQLIAEKSSFLADLSREFDEINEVNLSPLVTNIQTLEKQKSMIDQDINDLSRRISFIEKVSDFDSSLQDKLKIIEKLTRNIANIQNELKGLDNVIDALSELLSDYLGESGLQRCYGFYYDKKFTPYFREMSYYDNSSGGVRTILSIISFLVRLHYTMDNECNLPTFFMLDTPGQNIGRGKREIAENTMKSSDKTQSFDPDTSDPALYDKIYKQLIKISNKAKNENIRCQIIAVDNDLPNFLIDSKEIHIVKRFSKDGGAYEKGLITDF